MNASGTVFDAMAIGSESPVSLCARSGYSENLKLLLDAGYAADCHDARGWYSIHEAAYSNHLSCLKCLFEIKKEGVINVNWRSFAGETALLLACQRDSFECVQLLLEYGADPNISSNDDMYPIIAGSSLPDDRIVRSLIDHGADLNVTYYNGWTALHEAACCGNSKVISVVPLHSANNFLKVVELLIAHGANVEHRDVDGITPAFAACQYGKDECLRLILRCTKNAILLVDGKTNDGASCVYIASQEGYSRCLTQLVMHSADANVCSNDHVHPLVAAVRFDRSECVKILLALVDVDVVNENCREDPLFVATEHNCLTSLEMLLDGGRFPLERTTNYFQNFAVPIYMYLQPLLTRYNATPLGCAIAKTNYDAARLLLKYGASTVVTDDKAYSPLCLAVLKRRNPELLQLLLEHGYPVNFVSKNSLPVPDALLMVLHPLFRNQMKTLLNCGLDPSLKYFCNCIKREWEPEFVGEQWTGYTLLKELTSICSKNELLEFVRLCSEYASFPSCCSEWKVALGEDWHEVLHLFEEPTPLTDLCRIEIRKSISSQLLLAEQWVIDFNVPEHVKLFLLHE